MKYKVVGRNPVLRFWYRGGHTHPIRRTGLLVEWQKEKGYFRCLELREGNTVRNPKDAPVKTYRFSRIAKGINLRNGSKIRQKLGKKTTLARTNLLDLLEWGA